MVYNPNKNGCPINKLDWEYKSLVGERIPFLKLGYSLLGDFLRDIPDTVLIEEDPKQA